LGKEERMPQTDLFEALVLGASKDSANMRLTRRYLHDTVTLETEFVTTSGAAVLIVFMHLRSEKRGGDEVIEILRQANRTSD